MSRRSNHPVESKNNYNSYNAVPPKMKRDIPKRAILRPVSHAESARGERRRRGNLLLTTFFFLGLLFCGASVPNPGWESAVHRIGFALITGSAIVFLLLGTPRELITTTADLEMLEDLEDTTVCLVVVHMFVRGKRQWTDRGIAFFEDGCLCFVGKRTTLSLGGQDLVKRQTRYLTSSLRGGRLYADEERLALRSLDGRRTTLVVRPLIAVDSARATGEAAFRKALINFKATRPETTLPRQYPPLGPPN